ncbi:MAG: MBL fold metallo-hydrolase [Proteobacteria bacterium]|nr:MBL fold metallo-hydrolase [Pseudomonadota bacterium]
MMVIKTLAKRTSGKIMCFAMLGIVCFIFALSAPALSADDFSVTLLGTGMPVPSPDRFGNSTLIEAGGQRLVFDMGRGITIRLWQKQIPLGSIDAHFLTHLHSDHINGLSDLWLSGWIQTPFGGRKKPFLIYGPPGTEKMMANLWEAFSEDRRIRLEDEKNPLAGIQVDAHDFKPGVVYEKNGVVVTAFEVDHGDLVKPCYGFKITYKNNSVVISGDTRYSVSLEKAARSADLLICEVAMIPEKLFGKFPAYKAIYEHHISPELAGKLFTASRPKLAVYTHLVLSGLPKEGIPFPTPEELLAATRKTYDGRVVVGADLMGFKIDDTGVLIVEPPRR